MTETTCAEVYPDPDTIILISEDIDIVISTPYRPELGAGPILEIILDPLGKETPSWILEEWMIDRCISGTVRSPYPESDRRLDLIGDLVQSRISLPAIRPEVVEGQVRPDRGIPAGDIEPDPYHTHLVVEGCDPTDRHHIAEVTTSHYGYPFCPTRDILQLRQCIRIVLTRDLHLPPITLRAWHQPRTRPPGRLPSP